MTKTLVELVGEGWHIQLKPAVKGVVVDVSRHVRDDERHALQVTIRDDELAQASDVNLLLENRVNTIVSLLLPVIVAQET